MADLKEPSKSIAVQQVENHMDLVGRHISYQGSQDFNKFISSMHDITLDSAPEDKKADFEQAWEKARKSIGDEPPHPIFDKYLSAVVPYLAELPIDRQKKIFRQLEVAAKITPEKLKELREERDRHHLAIDDIYFNRSANAQNVDTITLHSRNAQGEKTEIEMRLGVQGNEKLWINLKKLRDEALQDELAPETIQKKLGSLLQEGLVNPILNVPAQNKTSSSEKFSVENVATLAHETTRPGGPSYSTKTGIGSQV